MPARRLLMRKIREVLKLRHEQGLSHQAVARACGVGLGTVNRYLRRAAECGLGWPLPADLDDAALEARLFPRGAPVRDRVRPDCAHIHRELKRDGVTLQLLWEEYAGVHPDGYRYTQFCGIYRQWARRLRPSMRQVHRAGEKTFIDFSGKRPALVYRQTEKLRRVELFVALLRGERLHVRRADRDPAVAGLGRHPRPYGRVLPRVDPAWAAAGAAERNWASSWNRPPRARASRSPGRGRVGSARLTPASAGQPARNLETRVRFTPHCGDGPRLRRRCHVPLLVREGWLRC